MRLKLSAKSSRNFRRLMIIAGVIGFIIGLIIPAAIDGFRGSILMWIVSPIILAAIGVLLVVGFYLIFLNKGVSR